MKIYNTILKAATLGIFAAAALAGCKTEPDDPKLKSDPVCECTDKEHFVPCDCPVNGTEKCDCTVKPRGHIEEIDTLLQIPIYQNADVSDEDAAPATQNIIGAFTNLQPGRKDAIKGKLKEIWIVANTNNGNGYDGNYDFEVKDNQVILKIKFGLDLDDSKNCFTLFITQNLPGLSLSKAPARNGIRLADGNWERRGTTILHPIPRSSA